mgnify:CR=1 FL=1
MLVIILPSGAGKAQGWPGDSDTKATDCCRATMRSGLRHYVAGGVIQTPRRMRHRLRRNKNIANQILYNPVGEIYALSIFSLKTQGKVQQCKHGEKGSRVGDEEM